MTRCPYDSEYFEGFWDYWWNLADVMVCAPSSCQLCQSMRRWQVMVLCVLATLYYLLMHDTRRGGLEAEEAIIADEVGVAQPNTCTYVYFVVRY